jgi:hypothetical protein
MNHYRQCARNIQVKQAPFSPSASRTRQSGPPESGHRQGRITRPAPCRPTSSGISREEPLPRVDHEPGTVHHVALGDLLRPISERLNLLPDARGVRHPLVSAARISHWISLAVAYCSRNSGNLLSQTKIVAGDGIRASCRPRAKAAPLRYRRRWPPLVPDCSRLAFPFSSFHRPQFAQKNSNR